MHQKLLRNGNSLAVTVPSDFAKVLGLRPGQTVIAKPDLAHLKLTYTFPDSGQLSLLAKQ